MKNYLGDKDFKFEIQDFYYGIFWIRSIITELKEKYIYIRIIILFIFLKSNNNKFHLQQ